jgi:hypothetical protein
MWDKVSQPNEKWGQFLNVYILGFACLNRRNVDQRF